MLRLERRTEVWGTSWFVCSALVLSFLLASLLLAPMRSGSQYDLVTAPQVAVPGNQLVMVVRVPANAASVLEAVR